MGAVQWIFSNWRLKLKVLSVLSLLATIVYQHQAIQRLENINSALGVERRRAAEAIAGVVSDLERDNSSSSQHTALAPHILTLHTATLLLGAGAVGDDDGGGGDSGHGEVCPERYRGNIGPYHYNSWEVEDCEYGLEMRELVSLVFTGDTRQQVERVTTSLWRHYPGLPVIIRSHLDLQLEGVVRVREDLSLAEVGEMVGTKYVVVAEDLDYLSNWTSLARAVRLLSSQHWLGVAGAVRNSSGHWR